MTPQERLASMGISLPAVPRPIGSYVPALRWGTTVLTSGQLPSRDGRVMFAGKVGSEIPLERAIEAAHLAAVNALAAAAEAAGGVDEIVRVLRACVYVNSAPGFIDQPKVANGASDFLGAVFGEAGRHVRAAVGVAELPLNAAVELELIVEVRSQ